MHVKSIDVLVVDVVFGGDTNIDVGGLSTKGGAVTLAVVVIVV